MTPIELKQWQADLHLSDVAMSAYLGVPLSTYAKWPAGTRAPDSATLRLFAILQRIGGVYPILQGELVQEARTSAPESAPRRRGRPAKGIGATQAENSPQAPETPVPEIPSWLTGAV